MAKPRIVQCLCGPARHAIAALAYDPGADALIVMTEANAVGVITKLVDAGIKHGALNPWCAICNANRKQWVFEDSALAFDSLEEARPYLVALEVERRRAYDFFKAGRN